ncbi:MAG TPA: ATP-dependent 6-phosphofructokinase [Spirochaetota bacterium]|nr:ATP-dependent 6-phosphofructokinase [Spirochaetota bacterium]
MKHKDTEVASLGACRHDSPLRIPRFIDDGARVIADVEYERVLQSFRETGSALSFENAGPRRKIFFDPAKTKAAIVTCGGLCPGLNNVIKSLVENLYYQYGVKDIVGVPFGYEGLIPSYGHGFIPLVPNGVEDIHEKGGSILGSSRGMQDVPAMVDTLERERIDILFTIGGDGTFHGSHELFLETQRRKLPISIAGIPKTIDNDINFVDRTFGFSTAVSIATMAMKGAHAEATGARNGIGLVKVMGRDSGFIAAYTALASNVANYVLIREVPFALDGPEGLLAHLEKRLEEQRHAVILVAEGAGQEFFQDAKGTDASGNVKYGDIGLYLKDRITGHFKARKFHANLKYIDPSYIIRSMPAAPDDAVFCIMLAQNAVHGAMAGKSGFMVGRWANYFTFMPLPVAISKRKMVEHDGYLWSIVREATGQPDFA